MTAMPAPLDPSPAMAEAFARIAALNAGYAIRAARLAADRRLAFLISAADAYAGPRITEPGLTGARQMFANLMRPEQVMMIRAEALAGARKAQLEGRHIWARDELAKAARLRAEYRTRTATQQKAA